MITLTTKLADMTVKDFGQLFNELFDAAFDRKFPAAFEKAFDQAFPKAFAKAFPPAFDSAFAKAFPPAFDKAFAKAFPPAFNVAFDRKFPIAFHNAFDQAFSPAFDLSFDRKFPEAFDVAFDASFIKNFTPNTNDIMERHYFPYLKTMLNEKFDPLRADISIMRNRLEHVEHRFSDVESTVELIDRKLDQVLRQTNKKKPTKIMKDFMKLQEKNPLSPFRLADADDSKKYRS